MQLEDSLFSCVSSEKMAGARINVVGFLVLYVLATGKVGVVSGYRPFPYAFQNRHFPQSTPFSTSEDPLSWVRHVPTAGDTREIQQQPFNLPAASTRHLLGSESPATNAVTTPGGPTILASPADSVVAVRKHSKMTRKWLLVIILVPAALFVVGTLLLLLGACRWRKKKPSSAPGMLVWTNQSTLQRHLDTELSSDSSRSKRFGPWLSQLHSFNGCIKGSGLAATPCSLAYPLLQAATNNFSSSNLLGEGSFGHVYKARLDYGVFAAVKRLTNTGKQGETEFQAEVDLMSKIRHPNLVSLLGFSSDGPEPLLVYELMQNGSLHDQLHGPSHGSALTWHLRLKIALEAARGLEHLHENCKPAVIHRDFKASNILLDASFNAKVSDFGLALAVGEGRSLKDNVQVQGTFGYVAPEYLMDGTLTEKSDVYGFGVVLLELLTGRLPVDSSMPLGSQSLVTWATPLLTDRAKVLDIIDPCLQDTVNVKHLHQVAAVAVLCVQSEPSYRPLIADVVQSLVPLVPQELGGALRDPKSVASIASSKKISESADGFPATDPDPPTYSKRSAYSSRSLEETLPKSFEVGHEQFWEAL